MSENVGDIEKSADRQAGQDGTYGRSGPSQKPAQRRFVYFVRHGHAGPIKIGIADRPLARFQTLQSAHFDELRFLGFVEGSLASEQLWHEHFAAHRIRGEWYRPVAELLAEIRKAIGPFEGEGIACEPADADGGWRPIRTAPRDGTLILGCWPSHPYPAISRWLKRQQRWLNPFGDAPISPPSHWQPLPPLPLAEAAPPRRSAP
jgi:hypothetical protein